MTEITTDISENHYQIGTPAAISARIKECADLLGGVGALAAKAGISRSSLDHYLKGPVDFKLSKLQDIAKAADRPVNWLLDGDEAWLLSTPLRKRHKKTNETPGYALVPKLNIEVSAGHGAANSSEQSGDSLAFRKDWLRSKGLMVEHLALVTVRGDSMEPTLPDKSILLVDTHDTKPSEGIYILLLDDQLFAKRIQPEFSGGINIISDNTAYSPFNVPKNALSNLDIKGRVVWAGMDF